MLGAEQRWQGHLKCLMYSVGFALSLQVFGCLFCCQCVFTGEALCWRFLLKSLGFTYPIHFLSAKRRLVCPPDFASVYDWEAGGCIYAFLSPEGQFWLWQLMLLPFLILKESRVISVQFTRSHCPVLSFNANTITPLFKSVQEAIIVLRLFITQLEYGLFCLHLKEGTESRCSLQEQLLTYCPTYLEA